MLNFRAGSGHYWQLGYGEDMRITETPVYRHCVASIVHPRTAGQPSLNHTEPHPVHMFFASGEGRMLKQVQAYNNREFSKFNYSL
jgi:hypothetical protein